MFTVDLAQLTHATREVFEHIKAQIGARWYAQHDDQGGHGDITTGNVTATGDVTATGVIDAAGDEHTLGLVDIGRVDPGSGETAAAGLRLRGSTTASQDYCLVASSDSFDDYVGILNVTNPALPEGVLKLYKVLGNYVLAPGGGAVLTSVNLGAATSRQRFVEAHVGTYFEAGRATGMGYWTPVTYDAANFTASGGGTWTVDAPDQATLAYTLIGKTMIVSFAITSTNVAGGPVDLQIAIPGGFTAARVMHNGASRCLDAGVLTPVRVAVGAGGTIIGIARTDLAAWTATAANNTTVQGQIILEVQ